MSRIDRLTALGRKALTQPHHIPVALARRVFPRGRWGLDWICKPDGTVTFRRGGFVAAPTAQMLLARHNFEVLRIRELLRGTHFGRSLEIGCGFGRLSPTFAEHSESAVAVDINAEALALARGTYSGIDFQEASVSDLPFTDGRFDLVSTWTVLQHIRPDSIGQAALEIGRVLAPSGTLLMCEETRLAGQPLPPNPHTWHRRVSDYEELFPSLRLISECSIEEIDQIPGMTSPGRVMLFRLLR